MKKTMTINLGGMVYHIDEDAYDKLKIYLDKVKNELRSVDGGEEIYQDIETRIAELFSERLSSNKQVITLNEVEDVIRIMGNPEDISGKTTEREYSSKSRSYRRMFRDPDNRIIGGVCSGLAAYWRIDPTIVRLIFVILAIFGMAGVLIYLILWIVLPEANTVAQKLEMRGEAVNLSNIVDFFRQEFENVKRSFQKK
ncbi:MAG: PspC domain-containing protein [Bacteroidales bacterium]|jgi:phage shock protein PspC (stress-responsive transcriptional regulator)|nr:PspC domain-containing protein [Bacteroidales bacterium]